MFVRVKPAGRHRYLQFAQNYREGRKVKPVFVKVVVASSVPSRLAA